MLFRILRFELLSSEKISHTLVNLCRSAVSEWGPVNSMDMPDEPPLRRIIREVGKTYEAFYGLITNEAKDLVPRTD